MNTQNIPQINHSLNPVSNNKSYLKLILVIGLITIILFLFGAFYILGGKSITDNRQITPTNIPSVIPIQSQTSIKVKYQTKEKCEVLTKKECRFAMCDLVPKGKTFEEVCGKGPSKWWVPIN